MFDKIRPLGDRALIKRIPSEEKTESGLYIPATASQEKAQIGKVVAVGKGRRDKDGSLIAMDIQEGDMVFFGKYSGTDAGDEYIIIREDEILGVVQK